MKKQDTEFKFEIVKHIGDISEPNGKGWRTELNLVSFNNNDPKYDIRAWDAEHKKMGKGVTLTADECITLKELLLQEFV